MRVTDSLITKKGWCALALALACLSPQSVTALPEDAALKPQLEAPSLNAPLGAAADDGTATGGTSKLLLKPGAPLTVSTEAEDLVPTDDVDLARQQSIAYPDNPEASFIYAVALTRTSRVEEALKEIRRARRLADRQGGPLYFDKMIKTYEEMLKSYPDENRVRYGLAWAYYMKAYLLAKHSKAQTAMAAQNAGVNPEPQKPQTQPSGWMGQWAQASLPKGIVPGANGEMPHIKGALEQAAPSVVAQVRTYYQEALRNLDELLSRNPDDVWALAYRAHLNAEYTGDLTQSMEVWRGLTTRFPNNPAAYFFLGEGYLKQGNLKECLNNISKAIALRGVTR